MLTAHPAPRPAIQVIMDMQNPPLHWYGRPGGGWTEVGALGLVITELTIHWTEEVTPPGQGDGFYAGMLAREAHYHAFERDWDPLGPGLQGGDGLMYHYAIAPTGTIFQTTPETHRTWNAFAANGHNLAVVLMAGHGDAVQPAAVASLQALLAWFTTARADLPLVQARPGIVWLPNGTGGRTSYPSYGVRTHDESLIAQNRPPKGCCGIYAPTVQAWRAAQP